LIQFQVRSSESAALDFAEKLIDLTREDFAARCASEVVIGGWREFTRAPVHATLDSGIWQA
jgi:hypothetical protein